MGSSRATPPSHAPTTNVPPSAPDVPLVTAVAAASGPYALLGLSQDALEEDIRKAYRSLALQWHPDKHPLEARGTAEKHFKAIGGAYELLRDPQKRRVYDRSHSHGTAHHPAYHAANRPQSAGAKRTWVDSKDERAQHPSTSKGSRANPDYSSTHPNGGTNTHHSSTHPSAADNCSSNETASSRAARIEAIGVPPHSRIWFAQGSACVGRAYKGLEAEDLARSRQEALVAVGQWVQNKSSVMLEIQGCSQKGEVGLQHRSRLAVARSEKVFNFLTKTWGLTVEKCRISPNVGEEMPGIEIRALVDLKVDGTFKGASASLRNVDALDAVACAAQSNPKQHVIIEVGSGDGKALAQRRCVVLQQRLFTLGLPNHAVRTRIRDGAADVATFFMCQDPPPLEEHAKTG